MAENNQTTNDKNDKHTCKLTRYVRGREETVDDNVRTEFKQDGKIKIPIKAIAGIQVDIDPLQRIILLPSKSCFP